MRKVAMAMAVVALAGCGEGKPVEAPKARAAASQSQPQSGAIAAQEWDLRVGPPDHKLQAITDLTAWLLEHGFSFYIVKVDGKDEVLLGPFASKAEAEAKQALLAEKMARAKKTDTVSEIIEHKAAQ
ncbi:SPOR domain-containing protein [Pseudomonas trivialis]|uniref:SPOR domain-containing protein n=1 Tax=Pseudomonas trivialis TaxID=200450 RepID=UPI0030CCB025